MPKIRILIVDDHAIFRDALHLLLEREPDMEVVGETGNALQAVLLAGQLHPDIALMDLNLPDCSGIEAIRDITRQDPSVRTVALTMLGSEEIVAAVIRAGASGYVLKEAGSGVLLRAIRSAAAGGLALGPAAAAYFLAQYREAQAPLAPSLLTGRDEEILELLAGGQTNGQIAGRLCLSRHTVNNLLTGLYQKLGVNNRTEAVAVALARGLIRRDSRDAA